MYPTEISAGEISVPIPNIDPNSVLPLLDALTTVAPAISELHAPNPPWNNFIAPPNKLLRPIILRPPEPSSFFPFFASSPACSTSAVARPSGYLSLALMIRARLNGTVNNTPITPPMAAILATSK